MQVDASLLNNEAIEKTENITFQKTLTDVENTTYLKGYQWIVVKYSGSKRNYSVYVKDSSFLKRLQQTIINFTKTTAFFWLSNDCLHLRDERTHFYAEAQTIWEFDFVRKNTNKRDSDVDYCDLFCV